MSDMTDDWMNPPKMPSFVWKDDSMEKRFLIERERAKQWPPGSTEWATWSKFASREARDSELQKLRKEHPAWHLRDAYYYPPVAFGASS